MAGIYIHIPFCRQACNYCNFHFSVNHGNKDAFLKCLSREIHMQQDFFPAESKNLDSIYLGGGTPSLLNQQELMGIFNKLSQYYSFDQNTEVTLEANPDDLSPQYLKLLNQTPVNRLSIGIQSFHEADLKYMNRIHSSKEAINAIIDAQQYGFSNLTVDLIYGTPTLEDSQWEKNIARIIELKIPHISAYSLTVEKKTALEVFIRKGKATPVDEEQSARQFEILLDIMDKSGYQHYEISNFCLPGKFSRHNLSYWTGKPYLGLGPSAHSFSENKRSWNISNTSVYISSIEKGLLPAESEVLTSDQQFDEYIMTSLRTMWGCDTAIVEQRWGKQRADKLKKRAEHHITSGMMILNDNSLILTSKGKLFADGIASDLFI